MKRMFSEEHRKHLSESHKGQTAWNKGSLFKECLTCKKKFHVKKCHLLTKKFCSQKCYSVEQRKQIPWNKGKSGIYSEETIRNISLRQKGRRHSIRTEFKKGNKPHNYCGGITVKEGGYIMKKVNGHPSNGKFGYIKNSRLVVEKHLGITLPREYIVHHKNGNKGDDRIENLVVFTSNSAHILHHMAPSKVKPSEIFFKI